MKLQAFDSSYFHNKSRFEDACNNSLAPALNHINTKLGVTFEGFCLKQDKVIFTHKQVINIYIADKINLWSYIQDADFTLGISLFHAVKLTKMLIW